jgi:hypothetical protein
MSHLVATNVIAKQIHSGEVNDGLNASESIRFDTTEQCRRWDMLYVSMNRTLTLRSVYVIQERG